MPRRAEIAPRTVSPDPVYNSLLVQQLVNRVMNDGKKSVAESIVYTALDRIGTKTGRPPVEVLEQAVKTVTPVLDDAAGVELAVVDVGRQVGGEALEVAFDTRRPSRGRWRRWSASWWSCRGTPWVEDGGMDEDVCGQGGQEAQDSEPHRPKICPLLPAV